jgi:DNA-binding response OmpR family regulator
MANNKILVVDDEARMRKLIKDFLTNKGFIVLEAANGKEALDIFNTDKTINLIILDVMMPVLDGWATLREIRATSKIPIIMLTARGEERDELFGFELGVDEYIAKPFSPKILVARVEAILKRAFPNQEEIKSLDGITIDKVAHKVTVDGKNIDMSMKEFELLVFLTDNAGIALSREKILNSVWNYDYFGDSRTIDSHIKKVRKKLGKKGAHIQTVRGLGYKFEL